jgi:N-acetyl sugar amidotransferase
MERRTLDDLKWCSTCLNMSTRPRITFDDAGRCNACQWAERKRSLDWAARTAELVALLSEHRAVNGEFDCIVPVSGGKDGSYVAYQLKHVHGMNPLAVTIRPPLSLPLGDKNLHNFINSGYDHLHVTPNASAMRALNRTGLIEMGFPYYGWLMAIQAAVIRLACDLRVGLIFYGEHGEVEYGGSTETSSSPTVTVPFMKRVFLEGGYDTVLDGSGLPESQLQFFRFPSDSRVSEANVEIAHWSYFENWDPYRNYLVAKQHCGLEEAEGVNAGTFTNFAQNDQALYSLHAFLMYLKFGFGRATQDAGIEIRRGAMTREQGLNLIRLYDGIFPSEFLENYLEYFGLGRGEFFDVLDRWANHDLFTRDGESWSPLFSPQ